MDTYKANKFYIIIALAIIFLYLSPFYIRGQDANVLILDNVDGAVASLKVLAESGLVFGPMDSVVPQIMNGLPRNTFGTEFNLQVWLYYFLPPFAAYVTNITLIHLVAFLGMLVLLRRHVLTDSRYSLIAVGTALAFALLPFWPNGGLSVAGQPLVLYAFMNIRAGNKRVRDWIILALVPFYSSLVFSFAFFLLLMGIWWLTETLLERRPNLNFLGAIIFMTMVYMVVEYRLVYNTFFDPGFVSIRSEFPLSRIHSLRAAIKASLVNFMYGHFHAPSLQNMIIVPSVALALIISLFKKRLPAVLLGLVILCGIISIWYGFWFYDGWVPLKQQIGLLQEFNFSRFHWLHPLLWYLVFALALKIIAGRNRIGLSVAVVLVALQVGFVFMHNDALVEKKSGSPTYREFFAEQQYREIKDYIGLPPGDYRVVSIGIHPSISLYNGFYTLDGYSSNYPLRYKHEFRKIIGPELDKNPFYRDYFDTLGGSRCYMFVEKLMYNSMMTKESNIKIERLDIDTAQLKKMGGRYVFSALEIQNAADIGLQFCKIFENEQSAWKIYLYRVL
ncbi:MAG: DUF6044 family protein [Syntrophomonadaceae bacterium]